MNKIITTIAILICINRNLVFGQDPIKIDKLGLLKVKEDLFIISKEDQEIHAVNLESLKKMFTNSNAIATIKNTRGVVVLSKTELNNLNIDSLLDGQYIIELKEKNSLYLITLLKQ